MLKDYNLFLDITKKNITKEEYDDIDEYVNLIVNKKQNLCFNSPGGCGKSYTMKKLYVVLKNEYTNIRSILTSSTGISAVNIGGVTLHHFLGIRLGDKDVATLVYMINKQKKCREKWKTIDYIFIDEISMLGGSLLDKLNLVAQQIRRNNDPFGGIKFVVSGDHMQLKCINDYWYFQSDIWNDLNFLIIRNFTPYRYPDLEWFKILMRIRVGKIRKSDIARLKERIITTNSNNNSVLVYSKNQQVIYENAMRLEQLKTPIKSFKCYDFAFKKENKNLVKIDTLSKVSGYSKIMDDVVPQVLDLKVGAECILTFNKDVTNGLANGTKCRVHSFVGYENIIELFQKKIDKNIEILPDDISELGMAVNIELSNGEIHNILYTSFSIEDDDIIYYRFQIPLKIAYALTIHKCQGLTLSSMCTSIDSDIFCSGQAYVALSRCKKLEDLYLLNLDPKKIIVDTDALEYEKILEED